MTFREQMVVRILLLVARIFAEDPTLQTEIKQLATHISVNAPKEDAS